MTVPIAPSTSAPSPADDLKEVEKIYAFLLSVDAPSLNRLIQRLIRVRTMRITTKRRRGKRSHLVGLLFERIIQCVFRREWLSS